MKIYVINEIGFEYDDENYRSRNDDGKPVGAYRDRKNAEAACAELNAKARTEGRYLSGYEGEDDEPPTYYSVAELDVADAQVSYKSAREAVAAARDAARKVARSAFEEGAVALFAGHPDLKSFGWTQYTPYFSDGDENIFGVRNDEPDVNGQEGYDLATGSPEEKLQKPVAKFLAQFDDEDMKSMFGDRVQVTVTKKRGGGVKTAVEEYHHD